MKKDKISIIFAIILVILVITAGVVFFTHFKFGDTAELHAGDVLSVSEIEASTGQSATESGVEDGVKKGASESKPEEMTGDMLETTTQTLVTDASDGGDLSGGDKDQKSSDNPVLREEN